MLKAPALLLLSLALAGCAFAPQARLASDPAFKPAAAWDGAGEEGRPQRTERHAPIVAKASQPLDATDRDADGQLAQSLVICKGCLRQQPRDDTRLAKAAD